MTAKKKITTAILIVVAAVALVAVSIAGTVAYLTASSAVSNTFTVGNVFIEMFESKVDDKGKILDAYKGENAKKKDSDGNSYHLQPGGVYDKDPTIYVQPTSDDCFLFVRARNQIRGIELGNVDEDYKETTLKAQMAKHGWMVLDAKDDATVGTVYVFCGIIKDGKNVELDPNNAEHKARLDAIAAGTAKPTAINKGGNDGKEQEICLFHHFSISSKADVSLYGGAKVTLTAFAIQTTGFLGTNGPDENSAKNAWTAIIKAYPYENGNTGGGGTQQ